MNRCETEQALLGFLAEKFKLASVASDTELIETGILDSMMIVEIVLFLEEEFGVTASVEDLEVANFATITKIAAFVAAKHEGAAGWREQVLASNTLD